MDTLTRDKGIIPDYKKGYFDTITRYLENEGLNHS